MKTIKLTDEAARLFAKYQEASEYTATHGGMTREEWEHARSYAVDIVVKLMLDNQDVFTYADRMKEIANAKKR